MAVKKTSRATKKTVAKKQSVKKVTKKAPMPATKKVTKKTLTTKKRPASTTRKTNNKGSSKASQSNMKKGAALRTRDEFLHGGVPKAEYANNPAQYYRVVYVIEVNSENEAAVVRRTTKKGRRLKTQPQYKFHEEVYTKDNEGQGIRTGKKFVRNNVEDIAPEDVEYIKKRVSHYPDTAEKMKEFKNRKK